MPKLGTVYVTSELRIGSVKRELNEELIYRVG